MKKADNFDAGKWLVENKITFQSRLNEGANKYPFQASPEQIALYDKIANELEKTVSMIANKMGTSESNIRISLDNLWSKKNRDQGMIVQIKADDTQWKEAWVGNALIMQTQNGEGVTVSHYYGTDINGENNPEVKSIFDKVIDSNLESLVASENAKIVNSLSPEELELIAPNTPVIVTGTQSRLNEAENTLEQDLLDFWDTLQDDAAQSDGEYKASWDTDFFLEMHKEYEGREAEVRNAVKQLKQQGKLSLYGKREKGEKGTGSVLDFVKQNFDEVADKASKATEYQTNQELRKERFDEVEANPSELIEGNEDLVQLYVMLPEYVRRKPANYDYRAGYDRVPTGKEVKTPFMQIAFDKNKITKSRSSAKKIIVNGVELYISHYL